MSQNTPRPLAPAIPHTPLQPPNSSPLPLASTIKPRRNITTACRACRKRRSKCDDSSPCTACIAKETECVRDEAEDRRKKVAWKRKVEELEADQQLLPLLMQSIRNGDKTQVESLVTLIRSNASHQEVIDFISVHFPQSEPAGEEDGGRSRVSTRQQSPSSQHIRLPDALRSTFRPIVSVPAKPWTTVTADDDLVSHLVSLWFTWRHWCYPVVDRDALISAMQAGIAHEAICTPYLVNMILADACFDYDFPEDSACSTTEKPLRKLFYAEGKRLFGTAKIQNSLPSIQFLAIQSMYMDTAGIDRMSFSIMHDAAYRMQRLEKPGRVEKLQAKLTEDEALAVGRSLVYTSWATFMAATRATFAIRSVPMMAPPTQEKPSTCQGESHELWLPYPRSHPPIPSHAQCHVHHLGRLFEIVYNIMRSLFFPRGQPTTSIPRDLLEEQQRELVVWHDNLIDCLQLAGIKAPHTYSLHAQYHWAVIVLSELNFTMHIDDEDESTLALLPPVIRMQHMTAALEIAELVYRQCMDWGVDHIPISFLQPIDVALAAVMNELEPAEHRAAFMKLAIALHSLSRRSVTAESMLRMLQLKLRQRRLMASYDIENIFKDANDLWEAHALGNLGRPKTALMDTTSFAGGESSTASSGDHSYDMLIEKWNYFNLGATASPSSSSN